MIGIWWCLYNGVSGVGATSRIKTLVRLIPLALCSWEPEHDQSRGKSKTKCWCIRSWRKQSWPQFAYPHSSSGETQLTEFTVNDCSVTDRFDWWIFDLPFSCFMFTFWKFHFRFDHCRFYNRLQQSCVIWKRALNQFNNSGFTPAENTERVLSPYSTLKKPNWALAEDSKVSLLVHWTDWNSNELKRNRINNC